MNCFSGRTAMITGGASGMGLLAGQKLAEAGANVVLCDVNGKALEEAAVLLSGTLGFVIVSVLVGFMLQLVEALTMRGGIKQK